MYSRLQDGYPPSQDKVHSRKNDNQIGRPSGKDGSQYECLATRDNIYTIQYDKSRQTESHYQDMTEHEEAPPFQLERHTRYLNELYPGRWISPGNSLS
jgi:hypothetical protein